jgi:chromosome segregation ATPase
MPPRNKKETHQHKKETQLKKIRTRITALEKKAEATEADIKVRHDQKLSQIRGQFAQIKEKLNELEKSTQEDQVELSAMLDDLEEAIEVMSRQITAPSEN